MCEFGFELVILVLPLRFSWTQCVSLLLNLCLHLWKRFCGAKKSFVWCSRALCDEGKMAMVCLPLWINWAKNLAKEKFLFVLRHSPLHLIVSSLLCIHRCNFVWNSLCNARSRWELMSAMQQAWINSCNDKNKVVAHSKYHNNSRQTFKHTNDKKQQLF